MNDALPKPRIPVSTYRLQFNNRFTFRDAARIIGYLHDLGITDIYASPYFKAKKGSLHGYDIVDHNALNPEIGAEEDYRAMIAELKSRGMGQVLDIVPNHMCIESAENAWWMDVLENGPSSPHASTFDIDWSPVKKELKDKVLIPVLGEQYGNVLESGELSLSFEGGGLLLYYYDHRFPLRPQTYTAVLEYRIDALEQGLVEERMSFEEYLSIITALKNLPPYTEADPEKIAERLREKEVIKRRLASLADTSAAVKKHIENNVRLFNGTKGDHRSFDLLDDLLNRQIYRLSYWRVATEEINYRRFFDINGLGAVRMENPSVFRETHRLIFKLVREGSVTGLRIDHPDGLYNPVEYFHRLQRGCFVNRGLGPGDQASLEAERELADQYDEKVLAAPGYKPFYIVGEKILTKSERMPEDWPIFSTTGYVFLNSVNGIFVEPGGAKAFDRIYGKFTWTKLHVPEVIYEKKKLISQAAMAGEVNTLAHYLNDLSEKNRHTRDFTLNSLRSAITEAIACFPVYRTYTNTWLVTDRDRQVIELAISRAKRKNPTLSESTFDFLKDVLLLRFPVEQKDEDKVAWYDFVMRFQQITGPVMAKGVEDTAFSVYNRLISLNEVGGMPERFGTPLETFHGQNLERIKSWPHALIATSTHDTKRSEDVRARINALSEMPDEWGERLRAWARMNKKKKNVVDGNEAPDRNEEYLFYQTLIGAWPVEPVEGKAYDVFVQRMRDYMIKALREAKVNSSWINPNSEYEHALLSFIDRVLLPAENAFLRDFQPFQRMSSHYGMFNSLSQTLLKICAPGVPDFYQGTDLWDFSLTDPDNRRPVDFEKRINMLSELKQKETETTGAQLARELSLNKDDGRIMLYLVYKALNFRKANAGLFMHGDYAPLETAGAKAGQVCAFARSSGESSAIVVAPRFLTRVISAGALPFGKVVWEDTLLLLPWGQAKDSYRNIFTGELVTPHQGGDGHFGIALADIFAAFPAALLERIR